jgi:hypothetical protein
MGEQRALPAFFILNDGQAEDAIDALHGVPGMTADSRWIEQHRETSLHGIPGSDIVGMTVKTLRADKESSPEWSPGTSPPSVSNDSLQE